MTGDSVEVEGLILLIEDDPEPAILELVLRSGGRTFHAVILAAEQEWTLNLRDGEGRRCPGSGEMYPAQSDAVLAALLIALHEGRQSSAE